MRSRAAATRRCGASESGQALLLAVIIMLLILLVGGLFVALVSYNQSGSERYSQATQASTIARMGIDHADHELMFSLEGADWRPPAPDWGADGTPGTADDDYTEFDLEHHWETYTKYRVSNDSYYLLKVSYSPSLPGYVPGTPAYIIIDSIAVVEGGQAPTYARQVAYKAVPLVSFGRFVTDFDRGGETATMGVPSQPPRGSNLPQIKSTWTGWQYYNVPVQWLGVNDFTSIQASNGQIWAPSSRASTATGGQDPASAGVTVREDGGRFKVSRIEPPDLDARDPVTGKHRLREGTKESGTWVSGSSGSAYNTGEYGWGRAIYVDNFDDVQFLKGYRCPICGQLRRDSAGNLAMEPGPCSRPNCPGVSTYDDQVRDLDMLQKNWLRAGKTGASDPALDIGWNATREWYEPKDRQGRDAAIKITLYPTEAAAQAAASALGAPWPVHQAGEPGLLIERSADDRNWRLPDGSDSGVKVMMFDYPADGVIYAEGNIRIKGSLPPSTPNRDYSLSVYSGATIYVDGNILVPEMTLLGSNTRIGLFAEDFVCVNATQLTAPTNVDALDPTAVQEANPADGWYWALNPGESIGVRLAFGRPPAGQVNLIVKQCAADDSVETDVSLRLNGTTYDFADRDLSTAPYEPYFRFVLGLAAPWISNSFYPQYERLATSPNPTLPWRLDDVVDSSGNQVFRRFGGAAGAAGAVNSVVLTNWGQSKYCVKRFKVEDSAYGALHTTIQAAIYAQNGSFFIIPGTYFDKTTFGTPDEQRFGRYNYDIWILGAVSEEHPAPPADAYQWMDKWTFFLGGNPYQPWVQYDPTLTRSSTCNPNLPKLPKLPLGPGFVYVGEG